MSQSGHLKCKHPGRSDTGTQMTLREGSLVRSSREWGPGTGGRPLTGRAGPRVFQPDRAHLNPLECHPSRSVLRWKAEGEGDPNIARVSAVQQGGTSLGLRGRRVGSSQLPCDFLA